MQKKAGRAHWLNGYRVIVAEMVGTCGDGGLDGLLPALPAVPGAPGSAAA